MHVLINFWCQECNFWSKFGLWPKESGNHLNSALKQGFEEKSNPPDDVTRSQFVPGLNKSLLEVNMSSDSLFCAFDKLLVDEEQIENVNDTPESPKLKYSQTLL